MGLDWCLNNRLRPGVSQEQVDEVQRRIEQTGSADEREDLKGQLNKMIETPLESVGAKRLDLNDPETVEAFRQIWQSYQEPVAKQDGDPRFLAHWGRPFDMVVVEHVGEILVNMVDPDGEAMIAHNRGNPFAHMSGMESFRGKRVQYCELIPEELQNEAFTDEMPPKAMLDYANRLEEYLDREVYDGLKAKAKRYREISIESWIDIKPKPGYEDEFNAIKEELKAKAYWDMETLDEAIHWLRFWAERGFTMRAWY